MYPGKQWEQTSGICISVARIRVERDGRPFPDRFRAYRIVLDGETVGRVKRGETVTIRADAGRHELHLAIDWARSRPVDLDLAEDDECIVRCWPQAKPLLALYFMTLGRRQWIGIDVARDGR